MFRTVNGEGLACDQMFCASDIWVDQSGTVLTSVVINWCGQVLDQFLNGYCALGIDVYLNCLLSG